MLRDLLIPKLCFKHFYISKSSPICDCVFRCKYPPPPPPHFLYKQKCIIGYLKNKLKPNLKS